MLFFKPLRKNIIINWQSNLIFLYITLPSLSCGVRRKETVPKVTKWLTQETMRAQKLPNILNVCMAGSTAATAATD